MPHLTWLGDAEARRATRTVPYRILEPVETVGNAAAGNSLIQGDNLEALKALLPVYAGRVKCNVIAPPYSTKSAYTHHDGNLEHSRWLSMMYPGYQSLLERRLPREARHWRGVGIAERGTLSLRDGHRPDTCRPLAERNRASL